MKRLILVTGSREWNDTTVVYNALLVAAYEFGLGGTRVRDITVMHGGCPTGADRIAASIAARMGMAVLGIQADWKLGRRAGPKRNAEMVAEGPDLCLAFPLGESPGTRDCMAKAEAAGVPVRNFGHDLGSR